MGGRKVIRKGQRLCGCWETERERKKRGETKVSSQDPYLGIRIVKSVTIEDPRYHKASGNVQF